MVDCVTLTVFFLWFHMRPLIASGLRIGVHSTDVCVWIRFLNGETLLQAKKTPLIVGGSQT